LIIREFNDEDTGAIVHLFTETVRKINSKDYSKEQIEAWAPQNPDLAEWENRLAKTITFVAEENKRIIGFAQLENNGHIDCFYVAHNFINKGVGSKLLLEIEERAKSLSIIRLFTEASITAKPFFLNKGFVVVKEQFVELQGVQFKNFIMEKELTLPLLKGEAG
jgi:putative acetyltransferase